MSLPPVPDGATVYNHPQQGKTVYVLPDGTMQCYRADGRKATTSATPAKLAAGYGAWEQIEGGATPVAAATLPPETIATLYIAPQLAQEAVLTMMPTLAVDNEVVFEQKLDGHRVMLVSPGGDAEPIALTRNGQPYTKGLPKKIRDWRFPEGNGNGEMILDGELVGDTYWVFDMPRSAASNETTPFRVRRLALEQVFEFIARDCTAMRLVPQAKTTKQKQALAERALKDNFEGLVAKRKESPYRAGGRTGEWLKLKFVTTADCIVTGVRTDGKDSVDLGMVSGDVPNMQIVNVGRASLIGKEKNGTIAKGDVIEVRYLYAGAGGRLYQPTIVGKRTDKLMHECTIDQMKHVNKTVLETL